MLAIRALDEIRGPRRCGGFPTPGPPAQAGGPLICDPDPPYLSATPATDFTSALRTLTHIHGRSRTSTEESSREAHVPKGGKEYKGCERGQETKVLGGARILPLSPSLITSREKIFYRMRNSTVRVRANNLVHSGTSVCHNGGSGMRREGGCCSAAVCVLSDWNLLYFLRHRPAFSLFF